MSVAAIGAYCCCWDCIVIVGPSMISNLYSRRVHGSVSNSRTALRNVLDIEHEAVQKKKIHTVVVCVYRYVILSCWHSFFSLVTYSYWDYISITRSCLCQVVVPLFENKIWINIIKPLLLGVL